MESDNDNSISFQNEQWSRLATQAQSGDRRAFEALLRDLAPFIRRTLTGTLSDRDAIEDIVQDVLISVHKSLGTYSTDRPFKPWLKAIIQFRRTDHLRKYYKERKNMQVSFDHHEFLAADVTGLPVTGELKDIEAALDNIPEKQRKIFTMLKIEGYSASEVANEMGMSVSAVKVSAHRTMNRLKDILK